eukprot:Tbor_TRINITY_DN5722_c0_g1::TRINITY_DN5722_c0_g1_i2::g.19977::m.19977
MISFLFPNQTLRCETSGSNSIEKKYRKPPIKLLLNILIISLLVTYITEVLQPENNNFFRDRFGIASILIEPKDKSDSSLTQPLITIDAFTEHLDSLIEGYYSIPEVSIGLFSHYVMSRSDPTPRPPLLTLQYREVNNEGDAHVITKEYTLTPEEHLGPFGNDTFLTSFRQLCTPETMSEHLFMHCRSATFADFADYLIAAKVSLTLRGIMSNGPATTMPNVVKWDITTSYRFKAMNSILEAVTEIDASMSNKYRIRKHPIIIVALLIPAVLWDICICVLFFVQHTGQDVAKLEYDSYARDVYYIRRGWNIFSLIGSIIVILFCGVALRTEFGLVFQSNLIMWKSLLLAFGAWFYCILLLSHFQKFPQIYVIANALSVSLPHLGRYLIGIFPILLGYSLCAVILFGGMTDLFETFIKSVMSLFSMLNGDSILTIMVSGNQSELQVFWKWFTFCFFGSFIIIFILNIHNIALNIVSDAYVFVCERQEIEDAVDAAEDKRSRGEMSIGQRDMRRSPALKRSELKSLSARLKREIGSDSEYEEDYEDIRIRDYGDSDYLDESDFF